MIDDLVKAIGEIDDRLIDEAENYRKKSFFSLRNALIGAICVMLVVLAVYPHSGSNAIRREKQWQDYTYEKADLDEFTVVTAEMPYTLFPVQEDYENMDEFRKVQSEVFSIFAQGSGYANFYRERINAFSSNALKVLYEMNRKNENIVYSPVNFYIALSMLTEFTDQQQTEELLKVLNIESTDKLKDLVNALYITLNRKQSNHDSSIANSFWMNKGLSYNNDVLNELAADFHASSFSGEMGSEDYNLALRTWVNENTADLLTNQSRGLEFKAGQLFSLVSTIYYKDQWQNAFDEKVTSEEVFHAPGQDELVDMMHGTMSLAYYADFKQFEGVVLFLGDRDFMVLALPKDNVSIDDLMKDEQLLHFLTYGPEERTCRIVRLNISLPKFDISSNMLLEGQQLEALGLTTISKSLNLEKLLGNGSSNVLINHACRVVTDEQGVTAAAYTKIDMIGGTPADVVKMVFDKPFMFSVIGNTTTPMFTGVVNHP